MLACTSGAATASWKRPHLLLQSPYTWEGWDSCDTLEKRSLSFRAPCATQGRPLGTGSRSRLPAVSPAWMVRWEGKEALCLVSQKPRQHGDGCWSYWCSGNLLSHEGTAPRSTGEFLDKKSYPFSREMIRGLSSALSPTPGIWSPETSGDARAAVLAHPELCSSSPRGAFLTQSYCCYILQLKEPPLAC